MPLERKTEKRCKDCQQFFEGDLSLYFYRNSKNGGWAPRCKECFKKRMKSRYGEAKKNKREKELSRLRGIRGNRDYFTQKEYARGLSARAYKGHSLDCSVLDCKRKADELHHVDYYKPLSVVPLCTKHHQAMHRLSTKDVHAYQARGRLSAP